MLNKNSGNKISVNLSLAALSGVKMAAVFWCGFNREIQGTRNLKSW